MSGYNEDKYCVNYFLSSVFQYTAKTHKQCEGNPYGVVANVLDCDIIVSKFEL